MIMFDQLGPAQVAALLVLVQRGAEELHSQRNTRRLLAEGGHEEGRDYYPVVAVTHLTWIASIYLLVPSTAARPCPCSSPTSPFRSCATG
jgi:methyltransferase